MQLANAIIAIDGDRGNTVPRIKLTAAEIAVLRVIHGADAVYDIEPAGEEKRTHAAERGRLMSIYARPGTKAEDNIVNQLFPGAAARVFETLEELGLPEDLFKAEKRTSARSKPTAAAKAAASAQTDAVPMPDEDGITDLNNSALG